MDYAPLMHSWIDFITCFTIVGCNFIYGLNLIRPVLSFSFHWYIALFFQVKCSLGMNITSAIVASFGILQYIIELSISGSSSLNNNSPENYWKMVSKLICSRIFASYVESRRIFMYTLDISQC